MGTIESRWRRAPAPSLSWLATESGRAAWLTQDDHATWRLLLGRTNRLLLQYGRRIHSAYHRGFAELFPSGGEIPSIEELNRRLKRFDWQVVVVDGYLPHWEYASLLAARTFPVAKFIRSRRDLAHSPVPDLAHDMIGHLPMLFDAQHRDFLQRVGGEMRAAAADVRDQRLYAAQQRVGFLRRAEACSAEELRAADEAVARAEHEIAANPSALARLVRFYLWTVEFGLMGSGRSRTAYGAALLSSARELGAVLSDKARIVPLTSRNVGRGIAFSELQRCYCVARNFEELHSVLDQLLLENRQLEARARDSAGSLVQRG